MSILYKMTFFDVETAINCCVTENSNCLFVKYSTPFYTLCYQHYWWRREQNWEDSLNFNEAHLDMIIFVIAKAYIIWNFCGCNFLPTLSLISFMKKESLHVIGRPSALIMCQTTDQAFQVGALTVIIVFCSCAKYLQ